MIKSLAALVSISSRESAGMPRAMNSDFPCHHLSSVFVANCNTSDDLNPELPSQ